ncbi:hypothetical protein FJT64_001055 [Amphibalanus amphitrite]|uniref:Uncharacterized protein n=1 Tax=Amphibalanus amphitrite TaxID=1232801 RepID=A0A6A4VN84_AMPAM|nr:hypothetical protein FJT64_001055 [Amphibalanus amphitrite]
MAPSHQECQQDDALVIQELVAAVAKSTEMEDLDDSAKASLGHSSGALARSATRRNKYGASASLLIYHGTTPLEVRLEKDKEDIDLTVRICHIWRQLPKTEANRNQLLSAINQEVTQK